MKRAFKTLTVGVFAVVLAMAVVPLISPDRAHAQGQGGQPVQQVAVTNVPLPVVTAQFPRVPVFVRIDKHSSGLSPDYTVPAGYLLVIESVDMQVQIPAALERSAGSLRIRPAGSQSINASDIQFAIIPLEPYGTPSSMSTSVGQVSVRSSSGRIQTRLYAQPGGDILLGIPSVTGFGTSGDSLGVVAVSGYLVPVGSPSLAP